MLTTAIESASQAPVLAATIAAIAAVLVGIVSIIVTVKQGRATREATKLLADREQWWDRFTWAAGELFAADEPRALVAVSVLNSLAAVEWIHQDDQNMILALFDQLNNEIYHQDTEDAGNG
ncbi:hypothetical protein [Arthrobacter sp. H5]|uniref:hypothetical protein n=1 Tax=Arthrobacter sp. H5 TaxID=1267973 RepID=UPI0004820A38|nr:hypothetical protein [Arthrobacter sp. H5]